MRPHSSGYSRSYRGSARRPETAPPNGWLATRCDTRRAPHPATRRRALKFGNHSARFLLRPFLHGTATLFCGRRSRDIFFFFAKVDLNMKQKNALATFQANRTYLHHSGWTNGRVNKYTILYRTNKFVRIGGRRYKVHTSSDGVETVHIGRHANHPILDARLFVGANDDIVQLWTAIDDSNRTTDRLLDY